MSSSLEKISIRGFKSIQLLNEFELKNLNVLIGANGAGKSNFVDFFRLLRAMSEEGLSSFVLEHGKADAFLFNGPKVTDEIYAQLVFGQSEYRFFLKPALSGELIVSSEAVVNRHGGGWETKTSGRPESGLKSWRGSKSPWGPYPGAAHYVSESVSSWVVYHFHDTSSTARIRRDQHLRDWDELRADAGNIAGFLYRLKETHEDKYEQIRYYIQLIAPYFDDFVLRPERSGSEELIRLEWQQKGSSNLMQPHQFSDGTIRFICLTTALLQPNSPATIVIDEPELGLHPFALGVVASMVQQVSERTQIIVSTQSAPLLDTFEPADIIVVDRIGGSSRFRRLEPEPLNDWLEDYTLGQLWQKNVLEGSPSYE